MTRGMDEHRIEAIIGTLLRVGVILAAAIVAVGGAIYLVRHGTELPRISMFRGEPADLRSFRGILAGIGDTPGRGLIQLGLLVLIATPIARVAFSVYAFLRQGDRLYVWVTLAVLAMLLYSFTAS